MSYCWKNDKIRHDTRREAEAHLAEEQARGNCPNGRTYRCEHCAAYHITKKMF